MRCSTVIEMSLMHIENKLGKSKKRKFEDHIKRCDKCKAAFEFLSSKYTVCNTNESLAQDTINRILSGIDPDKYASRPAMPGIRRKLVIVLASILLLTGIAANAESVYKSLDELINLIGLEPRPAASKDLPPKIETPEKLARDIYVRHKHEIDEAAKGMKTGEVRKFTFTWDGKKFLVMAGKTSGYLSFSVRDAASGNNIAGNSLRNTIPNKQSGKANKLLKNLISNRYFVPVLEPLPESCWLQDVLYEGDKVIMLVYNTDNIGGTAMLFMRSTVSKDEKLVKSLETICGYQAVYQEGTVNNREHASITVYFGEDKRQQVLSITGTKYDGKSFNRDELMKIAKSLKLYNEDNNNEYGKVLVEVIPAEPSVTDGYNDTVTADNLYNGAIFNEVTDLTVYSQKDRYLENVKKGLAEFVIDIREGVTLERKSYYSGSDPRFTCRISYKSSSFNDIANYIDIPLLLNRDIFEKSVLIEASRSYPDVNMLIGHAGVHYRFYPSGTPEKDIATCDKLSVDALAVDSDEEQLLENYSITDVMVDRFSTGVYMNGYAELVYSKDNQPYIVNRNPGDKITSVHTIKHVNGKYMDYVIMIPNGMIEGMSTQQLVDGFGFIR